MKGKPRSEKEVRFLKAINEVINSEKVGDRKQFVKETGISNSKLSKITHGSRSVKDLEISIIEKLYNVNRKFIYVGEEPVFKKTQVLSENILEEPGFSYKKTESEQVVNVLISVLGRLNMEIEKHENEKNGLIKENEDLVNERKLLYRNIEELISDKDRVNELIDFLKKQIEAKQPPENT